ncbi:MAG TPA: Fic family protein [Anaerovoracaceae bacterium]|nr:Fic family protein [Anaerovoracaceae bacterium]
MSEKQYTPPYTITDEIIHLIAEISEQIGIVTVKSKTAADPRLRHANRIRSIQSSLAIENNSLTLTQMTDIINGKRVLGAPDEIREVKNAYEAYDLLLTYDPFSLKDMLSAHKVLMTGLTDEAGRFRSGGVGVFAEDRLVHMAPLAGVVPELMHDLISWVNESDAHPLIKSCVFHYEFEFIHPFSDGNGRMGRMWQTLLLSRWKPIFAWMPVETLIRERQQEYYDALALSNKAADSSAFMKFMLHAIRDAFSELSQTDQVREQATEQVERLLTTLGDETLSLKQLMERLGLKHRPSFRNIYLLPALKLGLVEMTVPDKPNSSRQRYRAVKL